MTTASRIRAHQLVPFFRETRNLSPSADEVEQYVIEAKPSGRAAQNLRRWQRAEAAGELETDICTNCWAISVQNAGDQEEGVLLTGCQDCGRTICNFCHVHTECEEDERCRCQDCDVEARQYRQESAGANAAG